MHISNTKIEYTYNVGGIRYPVVLTNKNGEIFSITCGNYAVHWGSTTNPEDDGVVMDNSHECIDGFRSIGKIPADIRPTYSGNAMEQTTVIAAFVHVIAPELKIGKH